MLLFSLPVLSFSSCFPLCDGRSVWDRAFSMSPLSRYDRGFTSDKPDKFRRQMSSRIPISIHKVDRSLSSAPDPKSLIRHIPREDTYSSANSVTLFLDRFQRNQADHAPPFFHGSEASPVSQREARTLSLDTSWRVYRDSVLIVRGLNFERGKRET